LRVSCTQHTSPYVTIRQHTPAYDGVLSKLASLLLHTSPYVSIRQHTPAYDGVLSKPASLLHTHNTPPYVYRRTGTQSQVSHSHTDTDALIHNTRTHHWRTHSCIHAQALTATRARTHTHTCNAHTMFSIGRKFRKFAYYVHTISHEDIASKRQMKKMKKKA
jgi:hypothetical protein